AIEDHYYERGSTDERRPAQGERSSDRSPPQRGRDAYLRQPRHDRTADDRRAGRRLGYPLRPRFAGVDGRRHGGRLRAGDRTTRLPQRAYGGGPRQRDRQPDEREERE